MSSTLRLGNTSCGRVISEKRSGSYYPLDAEASGSALEDDDIPYLEIGVDKETEMELEEEAKEVAESYDRNMKLKLSEMEGEKKPSNKPKPRGTERVAKGVSKTGGVTRIGLPNVVIVGRPNVGKSALFNRLVGRELAIVHNEAGVTRDRHQAPAEWCGVEYQVTDTGGVLTPPLKSDMAVSDAVALGRPGGSQAMAQAVKEASMAGLPSLIEKQAGKAVADADVILFVVDGQSGVTGADMDICDWLRKRYGGSKPIILVVNKCESPTQGMLQANEFYSLGFPPVPVSAISGSGTGDLLDMVCSHFQQEVPGDSGSAGTEAESESCVGVAIVGRPNVGKSSILNALLGKERSIVSAVSGTTRDAIDSLHRAPSGQLHRLIDTAGIRRRGAVASTNSRTEALSVNRAFRAIGRSDVVLLVLDAMQGVTEQDYRLGERIAEEGKACVIVVNKWDTVPDKDTNTVLHYEDDLRDRLKSLSWAPIVYASAISGQRINRIMDETERVSGERSKRVPTAVMNQVIQEAFNFQPPTRGKGGKRGKIYYCTQAAVSPPTFVFFVNDSKLFSDIYRRYMEKQIRKNVGFPGTPIRLLWRSKKKDARGDREPST